ncbi:MAG: hypothetical protein AB7O66_03395 [Limisphaerales bacterium]
MDLEFLERTAAEADVESPGQGGRVAAALAVLAGHRVFEADTGAVRGYPTLEGYVLAARELKAYYGSPERAEYIQPLDAPPIVGGPVSVDWFRRRVPTPEGHTPLGWLAFCEWILRTSELRADHPGEFYSRIAGRTYYLRFRREDGVNPALTWAEPMKRGGTYD